MDQSAALDILKQAILLERRGRAFYTRVAQNTTDAALQQFFQTMAEEENQHIQVLSEQYKSVLNNQQFSLDPAGKSVDDQIASRVLSPDIQFRIDAAGFEAAAVSAAMAMEKEAMTLYAERAKSTEDPAEKSLYRWLSDWEAGHLAFLTDIDQRLKEEVWHDNHFWPF